MQYLQREKREGILVRVARIEDAPILQQWLSDPGTALCMPCGEPAEIEDCAKRWVELYDQQAVLTAEVDGVVRGMVILFLQTYLQLRHQCMHILVVDPAYRRKGVGSLLLEEATWWAREGCGIELLHTELTEGTEAEAFYRHRGYEVFGCQEGWSKVDERYFGRVLVEKLI